MPAVVFERVGKSYRRYAHRRQFQTLKSALLGLDVFQQLRPEETYRALEDVSFAVEPGETFGIIGRNGAGKSTSLKLIAGTAKPTTGRVQVEGRVSALIELGAGFHPEISGRENVFINGIMLGLTKRAIKAKFDSIVRFAELEEFIENPVKTYSSGMYMRLGFAVAVHVDPDLLLIDEVLAVGDAAFQHKCLDRMNAFKRSGKTIIFVSHGLDVVDLFCDRVAWIDHGRLKMVGDSRRVIDAYLTAVEAGEEAALAAAHAARTAPAAASEPAPSGEPQKLYQPGRWGSQEIAIDSVKLLDATGEERHLFHSGEAVTVELEVHCQSPARDFVFGVGIFTVDGICCFGTNTKLAGFEPRSLQGLATVRLAFPHLHLVEGGYLLDVACHKEDGFPYDYQRGLLSFRIASATKEVGICRPPHDWSFSPNARLDRRQAAPKPEQP
jgi:ABC-type polysaccharide/polyol phosphate transport system ATPase subunit